jgi:hypothetical protein
MADRLTVLVGNGLGPWCPIGHLRQPKLAVRGKRNPEAQLFVEYSEEPKYDGSPSDTIDCAEAETDLRPSKYIRVGYLGTERLICMVQGA